MHIQIDEGLNHGATHQSDDNDKSGAGRSDTRGGQGGCLPMANLEEPIFNVH